MTTVSSERGVDYAHCRGRALDFASGMDCRICSTHRSSFWGFASLSDQPQRLLRPLAFCEVGVSI